MTTTRTPALDYIRAALLRLEGAAEKLTQAGKRIPAEAALVLGDLRAAERAALQEMHTPATLPAFDVNITPNEKGNPPGKLAEAELRFTAAAGPLAGLKLIGFAVWESRSTSRKNVTFPARQYSVNGERRSFALLRPMMDTSAQDAIRDTILHAYRAFEQGAMQYATDTPRDTQTTTSGPDDPRIDSRITGAAPDARKEPTPPADLF